MRRGRLWVGAALLLCAGCKTSGSSGFGVALTISADSSLSDGTLKTITQMDLAVSGDESETVHYDFTRTAFVRRQETAAYRPLANSRALTIAVTVRDASGMAVGYGAKANIALSSGKLAPATVTLSAGGPPGGLDMAGGGTDMAGGGSDMASGDLACTSSVEDCFNGIDDNCDGLVDCADPTCTATAECEPMAAQMGTLIDPGTCPAQFQAFSSALNQGIHQGTNCSGCACTPGMVCHTNIYDYGTNSCPGAPGGSMFQSDNTYCQGNGALGINFASGKIKIDPMTLNSTNCTVGGTPALPALSWDLRKQFCQTNLMGGGCAAGQVCVPKATKHCTLAAGNVACSTGYAVEGAGGPWNTGVTEGRSCSACAACGAATGGSCAGALVALYTVGNCSGTATATLNAGNNYCSQPDTYQSATVTGGTLPTCGNTTSTVAGAATETGPQTVCCK
jgi:hypothetical protein